jgi:hypothetical protein
MTKRKPSPSHLERVRQRNLQLRQNRDKYGAFNWAAPAEPIVVPDEIQIVASERSLASLSSADFHRAEAALLAASDRTNAPAPQPVEQNTIRVRPFTGLRRIFGAKKEPSMLKKPNNGVWEKYFPAAEWKTAGLEKFASKDLFCCGAKEIHGINNTYTFYKEEDGFPFDIRRFAVHPGEFVHFVQRKLEDEWGARNRPFMLFTDVIIPMPKGKLQRGETIQKFIIENKLGECVSTGVQTNGNSGSKLQAFIWSIPDKATLRAFKFDPEIHLNHPTV